MKAEDLKEGTVLHSRTTKNTPTIEGYKPGDGITPRTWLVAGAWLSLSHIEARYALRNPTGRVPKNKKQAA